ncbi:inter-alpha-trypsin inhibitor heavy chain H3-like [Rhinophrynus dorsalis]
MENMKWNTVFAAVLLSLCFLPSSHGLKEENSMVIHSLRIDCKITSRFAHTVTTIEMQNQLNASQEAIFDVELPKTAFITSFSMTINNDTSVGTVKEKAEAKQQYHKAVSKGKSAGLVQSTGRKMEHFKISVNVAAFSTAIFKLTYEELLKRYLGKYEMYLRVRPKQLVENFLIDANIIEPQGISFLEAHGTFITNELTDVVETNRTDTKAHIVFKPTLDQQRKCPTCAETLLDGDFVIKYDVNRDVSAGNIQIINGYFVHYFAPSSLQKVPKNVVFVIDHSGSMYGNKIKQTYEAFIKILEDLPEEDHFGILIFDDKVDKWRKNLVRAIPGNIRKAKEFVSRISARGGTDINKALLSAVQMLRNATINKVLPEISMSMILFLSDGEPTSGTTDHDMIMKNVKSAIEGQTTLYCLGFGNDVDYNFLEKLSLENGGLARRIYEDSDAALQLQGFYNEVANPMLLDIHLQYLDNSISDLTQNTFRHYYQGSEIIVAGHINNDELDILTAQVTAQGVSEKFSLNVETNIAEVDETLKKQQYIFGDFTERLWAYMSIEQLLTQQISAQDEEKKRITEKALALSLKYNFVTPLTSMVVTTSKDEDENKKLVANKPKEFAVEDDLEASFDQQAGGADLHYFVNSYDSEPAHHKPHYHGTVPLQKVWPVTTTTTTTSTPLEFCPHYLAVISMPDIPEKICLQIFDSQNNIINLIHDVNAGITLNGMLTEDQKNFERFGLINKKMKIQVEITTKNITVTHYEDIKTYQWNSSFEEKGFLEKDSEKLTVSAGNGVKMIFTLAVNTQYLTLFSQNDLILTNTSGLLGYLLSDAKIHKTSSDLVVHGKHITFDSKFSCDFTPYGIKEHGSCLLVTIKTEELITGSSRIISNISNVPHVIPHE